MKFFHTVKWDCVGLTYSKKEYRDSVGFFIALLFGGEGILRRNVGRRHLSKFQTFQNSIFFFFFWTDRKTLWFIGKLHLVAASKCLRSATFTPKSEDPRIYSTFESIGLD